MCNAYNHDPGCICGFGGVGHTGGGGWGVGHGGGRGPGRNTVYAQVHRVVGDGAGAAWVYGTATDVERFEESIVDSETGKVLRIADAIRVRLRGPSLSHGLEVYVTDRRAMDIPEGRLVRGCVAKAEVGAQAAYATSALLGVDAEEKGPAKCGDCGTSLLLWTDDGVGLCPECGETGIAPHSADVMFEFALGESGTCYGSSEGRTTASPGDAAVGEMQQATTLPTANPRPFTTNVATVFEVLESIAPSTHVPCPELSPAYSWHHSYKLGECLRHDVFGLGRVVEVFQSGKLLVRFADGRYRNLVHERA